MERRLLRFPNVSLTSGVTLTLKLAKAVATLHRAHVIHRDIKPDNVIVGFNGSLRLLDLGIARLPNLEDLPSAETPGTPSYMAPELFSGGIADERSDLFALGVTTYRLLTGHFPYGEVEPFSNPRFGRPVPLLKHRPDLPIWLERVLTRAYALAPQDRYQDVVEFMFALEQGFARIEPAPPRRQSLYERNPLVFWKVTSALLLLLVLLEWALR